MLHMLLKRFAEPSSYAGLGTVLALAGLNLPAGVISNITVVLAGVAGLVAFFMAEKGPK